MKLKTLTPLRNTKYYVAFSGGLDSVAIAHYLISIKKDITLLHYHHNQTPSDDKAFEFVKEFAKQHNVPVRYEILTKTNVRLSPEEFQRNHRYSFLKKHNDCEIIMCHNLDDNLESWIFGSLHGQPKLIPYEHANIIRPFMLNKKSEIAEYAKINNLMWVEDEDNSNPNIPRVRIRLHVIPELLKVNTGFYTTISKKVRLKFKREVLDF